MDTNLPAAHRLAARKYQRGGILTRSVIGMMPTTCQVREARVTIQNHDEALRKLYLRKICVCTAALILVVLSRKMRYYL